MNLRTWAGLGLAQLALTLAQGLGFLIKSMGLTALQRQLSLPQGRGSGGVLVPQGHPAPEEEKHGIYICLVKQNP
jgi:hypothetical protein